MTVGILIWLLILSAGLGVHIFLDWRQFTRLQAASGGLSNDLSRLKEEVEKLREEVEGLKRPE